MTDYEMRCTCPHCQDPTSFRPLGGQGKEYRSDIQVKGRFDHSRGFTFGGEVLQAVFKLCSTCGYVGLFAQRIVDGEKSP